MNRLNIAILFGGCSPEYSVSLQSAYSVITHIDTDKFMPVLIGISSKGDWYRFEGDNEKIASDTWCNPSDCLPAVISPDRKAHTLLVFHPDKVVKLPIDAAFPVLHGKNGEDGTVQGLFEMAGIPIVGCSTLASTLCMDKDRAHKLAHIAGVQVPTSFVLKKNMDAGIALAQAESLGYPLFVKPIRAGSSYGITKVIDRHYLPAAIKLAFEYDDEVIVEESITGFEVGCAVMGNNELTVGEVDEIELSDGFFDLTEKYTLKTSAIHVPARISKEKAEEIKQTAKTIYQALGCRGFARVDMFLNADGKIIFNEVNTIPGFTSHSRYPNMMKAIGISLEQIISRVIGLAVGV
ncbi:D-alanine---D-serine ligase [Muricomes intestini]|uniref:D-alanine--D-alanine ligase n=2 Tax=Clostridia TaxID=186801 RepID=A0A858BTD4_9FIRM|nr:MULTISPECIES: D-alanine--D-serine ligase VanG [Clostridia]QIB68338.1 D-alanine--D-serine ligase VanG [Aminipila butyrica]TCS74392.1 D-alanine---D-serine ligase [Muricomes intestini]